MFPSTPSPMDQIVQAKLTFPKTRPTTQTWSKHIGRLWISTPTSQSRRYTRTRTRCGATTGALACMSTVRRQLQRLVLDVEDLPAQRGTTIAKTFGSLHGGLQQSAQSRPHWQQVQAQQQCAKVLHGFFIQQFNLLAFSELEPGLSWTLRKDLQLVKQHACHWLYEAGGSHQWLQ